MTKDRWEALMKAMGLEPSIDCFEELCKAYSEKHRFYHTAEHIEAMLRHFDAVSDIATRPTELELAIWFHDAIYKSLSKTNELDSAKWAREFLATKKYDEEGIERTFKLVMATLHDGEVENNDEKIIVDIDLTILGTSPEIYDEFERNVRKEYKIVPSIIYRKKRKELLKTFLRKASIYNLDYFKDRYEKAARENITRSIENL